MTSRWVGLGAAVIAVAAGVLAAATDTPWLGWIAAAGAAVAGVVAVVGAPLQVEAEGRPIVAVPTPSPSPAPGPGTRIIDEPSDVDELASGPDLDAIIDPETKLYTAAFFAVAVNARISAARRHLRPVSVVLIDVGAPDGPQVPLVAAAGAVERSIRGSDTACRLEGDRFGLVLEDTTEDGAVAFVERLRTSLALVVPEAVCWAGIACYPTHVFHAAGATAKASQALAAARTSPDHRVEVASAE